MKGMVMGKGRLEGKIAFVTGASSGIGEAIARRFLDEGASVVGCGRRESPALAHARFRYIAADISRFEAALSAVEDAALRFGGLDIVVNCAGITGEGSLETTSAEDFSRMFQVNVGGVFNVCKASLPFLRKSAAASIINIASDLGIKAIPNRIAYCPSKAAVIMLTRGIALEEAPRIRANCILPGLVETPMIKHRFEQAENSAALRKAMADMYPLKRMGTVEDMASAALYLAGEESSFVTGTELAVCGGRQV
jgi:NAD(P)-dependent dehydrogenase (short-subunit alcohol dehydrogenase family)